jgi:uncharacterized protein YjbI with pentapeptide repeats
MIAHGPITTTSVRTVAAPPRGLTDQEASRRSLPRRALESGGGDIMANQGADGGDGTTVEVVPSGLLADTPEPPVTHAATSAEPTAREPGTEDGLESAEGLATDITSTPEQVEASGDGLDRPVPRQDEAPPGPIVRAPGSRRSWLNRHRDGILVGIIGGFVVGLVLLVGTFLLDALIANRQDRLARDLAVVGEVQENTRFVRQVVADNGIAKPFRGLYLRGAALPGLDLACEDPASDPPTGCADFRAANLSTADLIVTDLTGATLTGADLTGAHLILATLTGADVSGADLSGADLSGADLSGVNLTGATLTGATLTSADLSGVNLTGADLTGANLTHTDLYGADLTAADLTDADLTDVRYDDATIWPRGFTKPPLASPR